MVFTVVIRPCQNDITVLANEEIAQPLIELLIEGILTQSNSKIASSRIHAIINVDDKWHRINAHASLQRSAEMQVHKQSTNQKQHHAYGYSKSSDAPLLNVFLYALAQQSPHRAIGTMKNSPDFKLTRTSLASESTT